MYMVLMLYSEYGAMILVIMKGPATGAGVVYLVHMSYRKYFWYAQTTWIPNREPDVHPQDGSLS